MLPFARLTVIGLGLIGSSVARAVKANMPSVRITGHDADPLVRARAVQLGICDDVTDTAGASVIDADLVILCVPVGAMGAVAADFASDLPADGICALTARATDEPMSPSPITVKRANGSIRRALPKSCATPP